MPYRSRSSHYSQLQPEGSVTIASLRQQNYSVRAIARQMRRSPPTSCRELQRNACSSGYSGAHAQRLSRQCRISCRPPVKLHPDSILWGVVSHLLRLHWAPEQIALTLARLHPQGHEHRVSHETIYNCIYAMRVPRSKGKDRRGQIPGMPTIYVRPPEIEDRQFPGHWEGDLISGEGNAGAVGTLVERTSRLVMLVKLPEFNPTSAANVLEGFTDKLLSIAQSMRLSMTYDQGREMAMHKKHSEQTGIAVYFCDPRSPCQRGSNENKNGLVRQYLPNGTDLSIYSQEQLDAIADEINNCPRKGLWVRSPLAVYRDLLINNPQHSTIVR